MLCSTDRCDEGAAPKRFVSTIEGGGWGSDSRMFEVSDDCDGIREVVGGMEAWICHIEVGAHKMNTSWRMSRTRLPTFPY